MAADYANHHLTVTVALVLASRHSQLAMICISRLSRFVSKQFTAAAARRPHIGNFQRQHSTCKTFLPSSASNVCSGRFTPYPVFYSYRNTLFHVDNSWEVEEKAQAPLTSVSIVGAMAASESLSPASSVVEGGSIPLATAVSSSFTLGPNAIWWLESCVGVGSFKIGLPGLAAQVCFFAPMEAMRTIQKEKTTGMLPLLPYSAMCANGMIWITYGAVLGNSAIALPNIPALVMGAFYWYTFQKYCPPGATHLPYSLKTHYIGAAAIATGVIGAAVALPTEAAQNVIGIVGDAIVIAMFGGPLAAIKTVVKDKSTKSLPLTFTLAAFVNCSLWTIYGSMVVGDIYIWLPNLLGLASSIAQLGLFAKYGVHKE